MSSAISPFLTLHTVLPLLVEEPHSIPLLSALVHLLAAQPPSTAAASSTARSNALPLPTLHQARLALARELLAQVRLQEAESELGTAEKEARKGKPAGVWAGEAERAAWREVVGMLVDVQVALGRDGRARQWRLKLESDA
jgi:hypothetical protein